MDKRIKEPCPFCGCKAEDIIIKTFDNGCEGQYKINYYSIQCPNCYCGFVNVWETNKQFAIDKWNGRYR